MIMTSNQHHSVARLALVISLMAVAQPSHSQDRQTPTPGGAFCINQQSDLSMTGAKAVRDDAAAIQRMVDHYMLCVGDDETGFLWLERLGDTGDQEARQHVLRHLKRLATPESAKRAKALRNRWNVPAESN